MPEISCVVCLAGRNEQLATKLRKSFSDQPKVHVYEFTERMPEILAAADVLVHSTGGVTHLEATAVGTPVVAYGLPVGHARLNTRAMAELELLRLANNIDELGECVRASFSLGSQSSSNELNPVSAGLVLATPRRVSVIPRWRLRLATISMRTMLLLVLSAWMLSTGEITALAAKIMRTPPLSHVQTTQSDVALIVNTPTGDLAVVSSKLASEGVRATVADEASIPSAIQIGEARALGEELLPAVPGSAPLRWERTLSLLRAQERAFGLPPHSYYLQPPGGLSLGQLVLGRLAGARPVRGASRISATAPLPQQSLLAGDVLVVDVDGSPASLTGLEHIVAWLGSTGLHVVSLHALITLPSTPVTAASSSPASRL
jgi:hypothetical protein